MYRIIYDSGAYPTTASHAFETRAAAEVERARLAGLEWSTVDGPFDPAKLVIEEIVPERIRPLMGVGSTGEDWFEERG